MINPLPKSHCKTAARSAHRTGLCHDAGIGQGWVGRLPRRTEPGPRANDRSIRNARKQIFYSFCVSTGDSFWAVAQALRRLLRACWVMPSMAAADD